MRQRQTNNQLGKGRQIETTQDEKRRVQFTLKVGEASPSAAGLEKWEVERTRVFRWAIKDSENGKYGTVTDVRGTITYRADGSGNAAISFNENIKWRLEGGSTQVVLTDGKDAALVSWEIAFWRQCGSRTISFERTISADIGSRVAFIMLSIDGDGIRCR